MPLSLSRLQPARGSRTKKTRIGRGNGSGIGTYSGRGLKGQRARSGGRSGLRLMALKRTFMKLPKFKGQKPISAPSVVFTVDMINELAAGGMTTISKSVLIKAGLIPAKTSSVKIVGGGTFTQAVNVKGITLTQSALDSLVKAGGKANTARKEKKTS